MATFEVDQYQSPSYSYGSGSGVYSGLIDTEQVTTSASSAQSAVFNDNTGMISVQAIGGAVRVEVGTNPTATATSKYLQDGENWDYEVPKGQSYRIAVIDA